MPKFIGPSTIAAPTVRRGLSERYGSWNTICTRLRCGRSARGRELRDVGAFDQDRAVGRLDQPRDAARDRGFAGAGLADDAERLAAPDVRFTSFAACTSRRFAKKPPDT